LCTFFTLQVIVHVLHAGDALRSSGGLEVLRVARHGAVKRHVPAYVPDGDVCRVDERVEGEFCFDCLADICSLAHLHDPLYGGRGGGLPLTNQSTPQARGGKGDGGSRDIGPRYIGSARRRSNSETIGGLEKYLLQLARQIAAPHQARRGGQPTLFDANGNHVMRAGASRPVWPCQF